jgi:quercetin dioxygenase-like cupin family protein
VFAYIVQGAVRSRLGEGGRDSVYTVGQSFYEAPLTLHRSSNASASAPAVLLAVFVCDRRGPLTIPAEPSSSKPR